MDTYEVVYTLPGDVIVRVAEVQAANGDEATQIVIARHAGTSVDVLEVECISGN